MLRRKWRPFLWAAVICLAAAAAVLAVFSWCKRESAVLPRAPWYGRPQRMSETLYIQTDKNMQVTFEKVHLQDIAQLSCSNPRVLNRCGILKVVTLPRGKYGRYPVSVIEVIRKIQQQKRIWRWSMWASRISAHLYGAGGKKPGGSLAENHFCLPADIFRNHVFHYDLQHGCGCGTLFQKIHTLFTGRTSNGFSVLEISYSLGIGIGVVCFSTISEKES